MSAKTIQYKHLRVSSNSDLYKAIEEGDQEKISKMYKEQVDQFYKANPNWKPYPPKD